MIKGEGAYADHRLNKKLLEGWAALAEQMDRMFGWQWYTTHTFRDQPHPESANKTFRKWLHMLNRKAFSVKYHKRGQGVVWLRGKEPHKLRETFHYHALIGGFNPMKVGSQFEWMDKWNKLAGFARIFPYERQKGARFYISKYVSKGGEMDVWYPSHYPQIKGQLNLPYEAESFRRRIDKAQDRAVDPS